jgi:Domain of unknown function (DUF4505)
MRANSDSSTAETYPFISPCGKEVNYVTPEDPRSALVFVDFDRSAGKLMYPGDVAQEEFSALKLSFHPETGRLYHSISAFPRLNGCRGLLHPELCQRFAEWISVDDDGYKLNLDGVTSALPEVSDETN